ncbi:hypothetical protein Syun_012271 [Stephania yunnanensis]|uniref:Uncharacterized protein n=1 Tax=Stephania yunnanensis TaxID=152371 RepID=A0AAP0PJB7_9MAGN
MTKIEVLKIFSEDKEEWTRLEDLGDFSQIKRYLYDEEYANAVKGKAQLTAHFEEWKRLEDYDANFKESRIYVAEST